ncbi:MAG: hypothetical protein HZA78_01605 [Candidatus Schekmanbacteria bacterium]|nr:hypothetical protein [Candidatus Schekmanbacteria bacterium]
MQIILVLILILILGYAGAHLHFYKSKLPLGTSYILFAGSEYLLLGLILTIPPLAALTPNVTERLFPVLNMGLGWIGLMFGLQFEWGRLRRIPLSFMGITLVQALITLLIAWAGLKLFSPTEPGSAPLWLLAAVASLSAPTCLAYLRSYHKFPLSAQHLVNYISSLDSIVGILFFILLTCVWPANELYCSRINLLYYPIFAGILIFIFHFLIRFRIGAAELLILTVGMVLFSSGIARSYGISPLLLNILLGIGIINLPSTNHRELAGILHGQEKPIYIIFLVLAGANWHPLATNFPILLIYLAAHLAGKLLGGSLAGKIFPPHFSLKQNWGLALSPQGGMGIALAVDYLQYRPGGAGFLVLNIIIPATIISQLFGPFLIIQGLGKRIDR